MKPSTVNGIMVATCLVLAVAALTLLLWNVTELARTNQMIHLLGALVTAGATYVYVRCALVLMD